MTANELHRIAAEQDAWGKWNTAPAHNRAYAASVAEMSPLRRVVGKVAGAVGVALAFVVGYAVTAAPIIAVFVGN